MPIPHPPHPHNTKRDPPLPRPTEIRRLPGSATTVERAPGSRVAYVGQRPWIRNATLRDNVLFGLPYDAEVYQVVFFFMFFYFIYFLNRDVLKGGGNM